MVPPSGGGSGRRLASGFCPGLLDDGILLEPGSFPLLASSHENRILEV